MQQRDRGIGHLAYSRAPSHLQLGFDQMRHRAADAAMAVTQETAMGVERHRAVAAEMPRSHPRRRFAASSEAKVFQQVVKVTQGEFVTREDARARLLLLLRPLPKFAPDAA